MYLCEEIWIGRKRGSMKIVIDIPEEPDKIFKRRKSLLQELVNEYLMVLSTAYLYTKKFVDYGENVTKQWTTAVQQAAALHKAYNKGACDTMNRIFSKYDMEVGGSQ